MIRTAKEWGWSPTALIRGAKNPHKHHEADYAFAHAVQTLDDEKCPRCGVPIWHAFSEDQRVDFHEDDHSCYSCQFQEDQKKGRIENPGETHTVRAVPAEGYDELPTRTEFFEQMHLRAIASLQRELQEA